MWLTQEDLIPISVLANSIISISYILIPMQLMVIYWKRGDDLTKSWIYLIFSAFILSCGLTHLISSLMFAWPAYRLLVLSESITAIVSLFSAIMMFKYTLFSLKVETVKQAKKLNEQLKEEVARRLEMELEVREINHDLANQVQILTNKLATQGWVTEKQLDLAEMKRIISELRKQYARTDKTTT